MKASNHQIINFTGMFDKGCTVQVDNIFQQQIKMYFNHSPADIATGLHRWQSTNCYIQDAFPFMTDNEREFLLTGITPDHWDTMFPNDDDNEDK